MSRENHYLISWWNCPAGMMVRAARICCGRLEEWVDWSEHADPVSRRIARLHGRAPAQEEQRYMNRHVKVLSLKQVEELLLAQKLAATEV